MCVCVGGEVLLYSFLGFETEWLDDVYEIQAGVCHFVSAIGCVGQGTGRALPQDTSVRIAENVFGAKRCRLHGLTGLLQFTSP